MCEYVRTFAKMKGHEQNLNILTAGQKEPEFEDFISNGLSKAYDIIQPLDNSNNNTVSF